MTINIGNRFITAIISGIHNILIISSFANGVGNSLTVNYNIKSIIMRLNYNTMLNAKITCCSKYVTVKR